MDKWFVVVIEILAVLALASWVIARVRSMFVSHTFTLNVGTGDNEGVAIQTNLRDGENWEPKVQRLYKVVEARRAENHQKWLDTIAKAEAEKAKEQAAKEGK